MSLENPGKLLLDSMCHRVCKTALETEMEARLLAITRCLSVGTQARRHDEQTYRPLDELLQMWTS